MEETISIGTLLRNAREKKKTSLKEIAQKTKININILKALEEDDIDKLPNFTYVNGFVKNYAKTIGVSQDDAKHALDFTYNKNQIVDAEIAEQEIEEVKQTKTTTAQPESKPSTNITDTIDTHELKLGLINFIYKLANKKLWAGVIGLVLFVFATKSVITWLGQISSEQITESQETPIAPIKESSENILEMDASKKFAQEVLSEQDPETEIEITKEEPKVAEVKKEPLKQVIVEVEEEEIKEEVKKAEVVVSNGKFPYRQFVPAPFKLFSLNGESSEVNDPTLLPPSIKSSMVEGKQNVYIIAMEEDTWISYQTDEDNIKRYVLKKGKRLLLRGDKVLLFVGNYHATKIFYNNKLVEAQTKSGVKSLIFPPEAAKDHLLPLFPSYKGIPYKATEYIKKMSSDSESI